MFDWKTLPRPIVALAPMAGYTDSAYRQLVKSLAPTTIVWSEFVSSDALKFDSKKTKKMVEFSSREQPLVVQLFGKRPEHFAIAAKYLESIGVAAVDINFGCPARKVVNSDHGSAILRSPKLAFEIVSATKKAVKIPVSAKMRLGVSSAKNTLEFAKIVESAGVDLLTIHGRTAKQAYTGVADYQPIYEVKRNLKIPVIGNGDVVSVATFHEKIGNLDGLMIGRGSVGNPWLFREIANSLAGKKSRTPKNLRGRLPTILKHAKLMIVTKGERVGIREMRKYFAAAVHGEPGARELRGKLVRVETLAEAEKLLRKFIEK